MTEVLIKPNAGRTRVVQSGKVYRQLFEAQTQLVDAYARVKEQLKNNPPVIRTTRDGIPLVREGRALRGNGFLTNEEREWITTLPNDPYARNPVFQKGTEMMKKIKEAKNENFDEVEEVFCLPDTVEAASTGSDVAVRIENRRKEKHEKAWEEMMQEIALVNQSLEPLIEQAGKDVLERLAEDDKEIDELMKKLNDDNEIANSNYWAFEDLKTQLLQHADKRKRFIDEMDKILTKIEDERVEKISKILKNNSTGIFQICYLQKPDLERLLDEEIQMLNTHILQNKSAYAELYANLITADCVRERNQVLYLESRRTDWRTLFLNREVEKFEIYIDGLEILKPENAQNLQEELVKQQSAINENRIGLLEALRTFKPPESTKTAVYNWHESVRAYTKSIEEINSNYIKGLRSTLEVVIQEMMGEIENKIKVLLNNSVIDDNDRNTILETKLLPIAGKKQKEFEDYLDSIERNFEEANQLMHKEIYTMFKFLQGIAHLWDVHELSLQKRERSLQELLQDARRDHDTDNEKREEKLDAILDQMRESSSEKDLKRLLQLSVNQLENIKKGYYTFHEHQKEIIKQYPSMIKHELNKYEENVFRYFSLSKKKPKKPSEEIKEKPLATKASIKKRQAANKVDSFRNILKEVLNTERGTVFYVVVKPKEDEEETKKTENDGNDILVFDEIIPNTKGVFLTEVETEPYLKNSFILPSLFKDIKDVVRINFLNHYENWVDDASLRSNTIVAAKFDEIDKELELRLHLHDPRARRAEMDVHNVRAAELIMHEERVDRHCKGVEETVANIQKQYEEMQNKLSELATQYRENTMGLESSFMGATKSSKLTTLQEQLVKERDKHMEKVKTTLRNYRTKFDETLQYLRNSNAKFRKSFNLFSEGGNFSTEEIDVHKKKLEKMASIMDKNETVMLKEMEKLEKKQLDEATKMLAQFQDKFKYHLIDLQFIEKISRWLNETQVKIKTEVAASNRDAKELNELIKTYEICIDACESPSPDKISVTAEKLLEIFDQANKLIYNRANYLKCFKQDFMTNYRAEKNVSQTGFPMLISRQHTRGAQLSETAPTSAFVFGSKAHAKTIIEDPALTMIHNIMHTKKENPNVKREDKDTAEIAKASVHTTAPVTRQSIKKKSSRHSTAKRSEGSAKNGLNSRRAKTRDEMYAYYCTFGEEKDPGTDFIAQIRNILRESLEGILTNAELYYRDVQTSNRQITRPQSIKEIFSDFAEAIIQKLKTYLQQCNVYHNQSLKEFRETVEKAEILTARIPELLMKEVFSQQLKELNNELNSIKEHNSLNFKHMDNDRVSNESQLRPNLGHPSKIDKLNELNTKELQRQSIYTQMIDNYVETLKDTVVKHADAFFNIIVKFTESLLLKFDEILTVDDINKHEVLPEKHETSELIRRKLVGAPLEDPEPEPLIKRGQGKWGGFVKYDLVKFSDETDPFMSADIITAKTTLPHQETANVSKHFYEKFKENIEENMKFIESNTTELKYQSNRFVINWSNSVSSIKKIHE